MQHPFNFDSSYLSLPDIFYSVVKPCSFPKPQLLLLNNRLLHQLQVAKVRQADLVNIFIGEPANPDRTTFAQAYAGHQFGHFTKLGDGRAIVIGECVTDQHERFDMQLKGSGRTPYSRGGDGKATLRAMLREYLMSEAMYYLQVPTSGSLAVLTTGEPVRREVMHHGAAVVRIMKSHIRVGTFEYAAHFGTVEELNTLVNYTAQRLYPEIMHDENVALSLLYKVMEVQVDLVANWMRVGFIHGVMNTDNTAISGETFDYGPCAFMNGYHPNTVYSSIDRNGRYAFGNQPRIIKWNCARLAEALLAVIHENQEKAIELAQIAMNRFDVMWDKKYSETMLRKIGFAGNDTDHVEYVEELLELMVKLNLDYTNTFKDLSFALASEDAIAFPLDFMPWFNKWKNHLDASVGREFALKTMASANPIVIPRNHLVEKALDEAEQGNMVPFEQLRTILSTPYQWREGLEEFIQPSERNFEERYQTFCGT